MSNFSSQKLTYCQAASVRLPLTGLTNLPSKITFFCSSSEKLSIDDDGDEDDEDDVDDDDNGVSIVVVLL